jgi:hypothetical protein
VSLKDQKFFKKSKKVLNLDDCIKCSTEEELWNCIHQEETIETGRIFHQILPVPIGILTSIFNDKIKGPISATDLYSLCITILELIKEQEELKTSAYIRALINFLATPIHIQEKNHKQSNYIGYSTKPITGQEKTYGKPIKAFTEEVNRAIEVCPTPPDLQESSNTDADILEEESEEITDAMGGNEQTHETSEGANPTTSGLAGIFNDDVSMGGESFTIPRKMKRSKNHHFMSDSDEESENSEFSSADDESDDDSQQPKKKRAKATKAKAKSKKAPPQCTQPMMVAQASAPMYDAKTLIQAMDSSKNYFNRLSTLNVEYIRLRNKTESRRPKNISPSLQAILEQCHKKEDIPGELRAAIRQKCHNLNICFNLEPLNEKFCERLMTPAQSHEETMVDNLEEVKGYSLTGFIGRGTKSIVANGQKVGIPATANQLLDMVGHAWVYQNIERSKALLTSRYRDLYIGLKRNEHQLRNYFDRGDKAFGAHITKLVHNFTTNYLTGCYEGRTWSASCLNFEGEIIEKITLNTYPHISKKKKNGENPTGSSRGGNSGGGQGGGGGAGDASNPNGGKNQKNQNKKRGTGPGPFQYTGPRGHIHKYLGREALASMGDGVPKDENGTRICFNNLTYEKCTYPGCKFSHKVAENMNTIESWISTNNLPFKKRE